ncbi:MAG TPA: hypothetical protein VIL20_18425 [Sandaracinaceae bacterium]
MRKKLLLVGLAMLVLPWAATRAQEERQEQTRAGAERDVAPAEAALPSGPPSLEERLSGTFELAGSREEAEARVHRAIDEAVEQVSWFKRSFARARLREKNPVRESMTIEVGGGNVTIGYGRDRYTTRNGEWRNVTALGEPVQLLQQIVGSSIYQTFRSPEGEKVTVYTPSEDGRRMDLDVTITSPQLPQPVRYELSYRRTGEVERGVAAR